jgi:hypothetical protein
MLGFPTFHGVLEKYEILLYTYEYILSISLLTNGEMYRVIKKEVYTFKNLFYKNY